MSRAIATRAPLSFERRCDTCGHIRDTELSERLISKCDLCVRKEERIQEGLFVPGQSSRSSGVKAQHRRRKITKTNGLLALQDWKRERRAQLNAEGIKWGADSKIIAEEEPAIRERLRLT